MKRLLPLLLLAISILIPLLILVDTRLRQRAQEKNSRVSYLKEPLAANVLKMGEELESKSGKPASTSATNKPSDAFPEPVMRSVRGWYASYRNGILAVDTGASKISTVISDDTFTVCTPQYWTNPDGTKFDVSQAWIDMSKLTLTNYRATGTNETEASFLQVQSKLTPTNNIAVFALESPKDKTLFAKKLWIVGCTP